MQRPRSDRARKKKKDFRKSNRNYQSSQSSGSSRNVLNLLGDSLDDHMEKGRDCALENQFSGREN